MSDKIEKIKEVTEEEWKLINEFNKEVTDAFLDQQHLSDKTLEQYRSSVRIFFRWVHDNCGNKPLHELKPRDALRYQNWLINRGLSSSAVKFKRSSVSSLCGFVELYYADEFPLFRNIYNKKIPNPPKTLKHEKQPLTPDEIENLISELENREEWQMIAYILFSYGTGCRRSETRQLLKEIVTYELVKEKYYVTHNIRCKG